VAKASSARAMCAAEWVAIGVHAQARRAVGTVGGRIAWARTPRARSASASATAVRLSPTSTGMMCVSPPAAKPRAARPVAEPRGIVRQGAASLGLGRHQVEGGAAAATTAGGRPVV
jgi:hypothetical protein